MMKTTLNTINNPRKKIDIGDEIFALKPAVIHVYFPQQLLFNKKLFFLHLQKTGKWFLDSNTKDLFLGVSLIQTIEARYQIPFIKIKASQIGIICFWLDGNLSGRYTRRDSRYLHTLEIGACFVGI